MSEKTKRIALLCGLLAAVVGVGYANLKLTGDGAVPEPKTEAVSTQQEQSSPDAFAVFRDERETTRTQEMTYIDSVISSPEADEATKTKAQQQKLALAGNMESEMLSEGTIRARMGVEAVVTIADGGVSVVVDKKELSDTEVTQIAEIVRTQTKAAATNIKIMPKA